MYSVNSHLHRLVEDAAADLHHLQVLLLLIPGALYVSHPAALVLLAGIDEVAHRAVFIEHLSAQKQRQTVTQLVSGSQVPHGLHISYHNHKILFRGTHLPHEVVILEQVHVFRGQDSSSERAHLGSCFDPSL